MSTPIGNLEDITLRALRLLNEVDLIAAEDTRKARLLFQKYNIKNQVTSYHDQNKRSKLPYLVKLLKEEKNIAIISEAGTPGLNDPGYELIVACVQEGIPVVPVPGPSVIVTALVVSGLPTDKFLYTGYLPRRQGERNRYLESISAEPCTIIALETPHRLHTALLDMLKVLGDRRVVICRELTKLHEEVFRGTLSQAIDHFTQPRGEFTLVIEGSQEKKPEVSIAEVERALKDYRSKGLGAKESVKKVVQTTGLPHKEVYRMWLKLV